MTALKNVLLVEDYEDILLGTRRRLEAAGYDVISARETAPMAWPRRLTVTRMPSSWTSKCPTWTG